MRTLMIPGLAAMVLTGGLVPAFAQTPGSAAAKTTPGTTAVRTSPRWGQRIQGRWHGGVRAPGGYVSYRRPARGFTLPRYWIQPDFYIGNYAIYGLPTPPSGYGWSRYYDDAVLTDSYGRVVDSRSGIRWENYEGGYADDQPQYTERRDNGLGGAAIGAVAGGLAGNVIAGRGNRTVGTVVGAAAGAIAGAAIDKAEDRPRRGPDWAENDGWDRGPDHGRDRGPPPPHHEHSRHERGVTYDTAYDGRWTGTWTREDGSTYTGEYEGRFEGDVEGSYAPPHWAPPAVGGYGPGGYISGGYYYPAPSVTTITITPSAPTYTETVSYVTVRAPGRRHMARRKTKCAC
ncbi:MAG: RcnB family protein [Sphingobium sp.]|uniref:RcnB family protein n=1 Tax=Sphingobium sp. TaxID=1912891 RepID=UPI0029A18A74|nr:RcnB family protein [Sphingobium sp.]MDX3909986.1 RcnB family protein [Sphingobium sp.]